MSLVLPIIAVMLVVVLPRKAAAAPVMENDEHEAFLLKSAVQTRAPAVVTKGPQSLTVVQNQPFDLFCEIHGAPVPAITWMHYGMIGPKQESNFFELQQIGSHPSYQRSTTRSRVHVDCASKSHEGTFYCAAFNGVGRPTTANATVTLDYGQSESACPAGEVLGHEEPWTVMWTESRMEHEGLPVQLFCRYSGPAPANITWSRLSDVSWVPLKYGDTYEMLPNGDLFIKDTLHCAYSCTFRCEVTVNDKQENFEVFYIPVTD